MAVPSGIGPVVRPSGGAAAVAVRGDWTPQMQNFKGVSYAPSELWGVGANAILASGYLHFVKVWVEDPAAFSKLHLYVVNPATGLTAGQCFGFVYSAAGVLLAKTADLSTGALASDGFKSLPLIAEAGKSLALGAPGAWVHCGVLCNGSGPPSLISVPLSASGVDYGSADWNLPDDTSGWRFFFETSGGRTSVPATRPASAQCTRNPGRGYWMGVS